MSARLIEGKPVAERLRAGLAERIAALKARGITPGLAVVLVGDDPASVSYVTGKERACAELGMYSREHRLSRHTSEEELLALVETLNDDPKIHGILVQLPLPPGIDADRAISAIAPRKDVDGFHPESLGRIVLGRPSFIPCTPNGVIELLKAYNVGIRGAHVVIVGRSRIVGRPLMNLLSGHGASADATVTVCHTHTADLPAYTKQADILIVAAGRPGLVSGDMIKPGAVVVDVGVNRVTDATRKKGYRLVGDVVFTEASEVASAITPVPGGVGPMTITMLMYNTVDAAERIEGKE